MSLAPYRSPEDLQRAAVASCARVGGERIEIGRSVQGRPIVVYRTASSVERAPKLLVAANIHGVEFVAAEVALGVLAALASGGGGWGELREQAEIWVIPSVNPDGYARVWEAGGVGTMAELRPNANGVDLNRNFPRPSEARSRWPGSGSDRPGDATYRGPEPLSEPETATMARLFEHHDFVASANLHSFMGTLIPARTRDRQDYRSLKRLCSCFAGAQPRVRYRHLASRLVDADAGEQEDFQYRVHRTWAICIESFPWWASLRQGLWPSSLFWRFNPRKPADWVANDVPGIRAFFEAALAMPRPQAKRLTGP